MITASFGAPWSGGDVGQFRSVNAGAAPPLGTPLLDGDANVKRLLISGTDLLFRTNAWGANQLLSKTRPEWKVVDPAGTSYGRFFQPQADKTSLSNNLYYDGTNWNLDDPAKAGFLLTCGSGDFALYMAAAAANPATLVLVWSITNGIVTSATLPYFSYSRTAAAQIVATGGAGAAVLYDTDRSSRTGTGQISYNTGTGVATVNSGGLYSIRASAQFAASGAGTTRFLYIDKNSAGVTYGLDRLLPNATFNADLKAHDTLPLVTTDTIRAIAFQDTGGNLNINANTGACRIAIVKVG